MMKALLIIILGSLCYSLYSDYELYSIRKNGQLQELLLDKSDLNRCNSNRKRELWLSAYSNNNKHYRVKISKAKCRECYYDQSIKAICLDGKCIEQSFEKSTPYLMFRLAMLLAGILLLIFKRDLSF